MRKLITTIVVGALLMAAAAPAAAGDRRYRHNDDDVDAGDVIASAVAIGGIAAIASAIKKDGSRLKRDAAVGGCSQEAEFRTRGRIAAILNVAKRKGYYTVEGAVDGDEGAPSQSFTCTIRNGSIYSFRAERDEV